MIDEVHPSEDRYMFQNRDTSMGANYRDRNFSCDNKLENGKVWWRKKRGSRINIPRHFINVTGSLISHMNAEVSNTAGRVSGSNMYPDACSIQGLVVDGGEVM